MLRLSRLYGTDVYTDDAELIGKVNDIILNLERGEVVRLTTYPLRNITKEEARGILKKNSVLYKNVKSAQDIIIVSKKGGELTKEKVETALEKQKGTIAKLVNR